MRCTSRTSFGTVLIRETACFRTRTFAGWFLSGARCPNNLIAKAPPPSRNMLKRPSKRDLQDIYSPRIDCMNPPPPALPTRQLPATPPQLPTLHTFVAGSLARRAISKRIGAGHPQRKRHQASFPLAWRNRTTQGTF